MVCKNNQKYFAFRRVLLTLSVVIGAGLMLPAGAADLLPVFKSGEFSENFAVYRHENFDAVINKKGKLTIQPKVDGKPYGKKLDAFHYAIEHPKKVTSTRKRADVRRSLRAGKGRVAHKAGKVTRTHWPNRKIVSLKQKDVVGERKPLKQPDEVTLKGKTKNGTIFQLAYKFSGNSVLYGMGVKPAADAEKPTRVRWRVHIPRSHNIPRSTNQREREKMLEDCLLVTKPRGGNRKVRHNYAEVLFFDETPLEEALVRGPWGARKLRIKAKRFGKHRFGAHANHGGGDRWRCAWEGYRFHFRLNRKATRIFPKHRIKMTIE